MFSGNLLNSFGVRKLKVVVKKKLSDHSAQTTKISLFVPINSFNAPGVSTSNVKYLQGNTFLFKKHGGQCFSPSLSISTQMFQIDVYKRQA